MVDGDVGTAEITDENARSYQLKLDTSIPGSRTASAGLACSPEGIPGRFMSAVRDAADEWARPAPTRSFVT